MFLFDNFILNLNIYKNLHGQIITLCTIFGLSDWSNETLLVYKQTNKQKNHNTGKMSLYIYRNTVNVVLTLNFDHSISSVARSIVLRRK